MTTETLVENCLEQVERHHKTGEKEIDFPDGTRKTILPSGREMSEFPDGVTVIEYPEVRGPSHTLQQGSRRFCPRPPLQS